MHLYPTLRVPGDSEGVPSDSHCGFLGAAKPREVITWPSNMWIQMCFSCFPRYVTFSKSFIPCSEVPLMTLEGFCGILKEVMDINTLQHLERDHRSVKDLFALKRV